MCEPPRSPGGLALELFKSVPYGTSSRKVSLHAEGLAHGGPKSRMQRIYSSLRSDTPLIGKRALLVAKQSNVDELFNAASRQQVRCASDAAVLQCLKRGTACGCMGMQGRVCSKSQVNWDVALANVEKLGISNIQVPHGSMKFHDENGHSVTCGAEEDGPFECLSVDDRLVTNGLSTSNPK